MVEWKIRVAHSLSYRSRRGQQGCQLHQLQEKLILVARLILAGILLWLLAGCGTSGLEPSSQLVQKAIALQINLTQKQLVPRLYTFVNPKPPKFEITRLEIKEQEQLEIQNLSTYHLRGTYNLSLQMPTGRVNQQQNPFEVYVQRQIEAKTWRLLLPQAYGNDTPIWRSYLIPYKAQS